MTGKGEEQAAASDERIGRLLAAAGAGTDGLKDHELDALREDLDDLVQNVEKDAHERERERRYLAQEQRRREQRKPKVRRKAAREVQTRKLPESARSWAEYQYRSCGRSTCKTCGGNALGGGHGPYWVILSHESKNRHVGRYLSEEAAELLAVLEVRRAASQRRSKDAAEILAGMWDEDLALDGDPIDLSKLDGQRPGWRAMVEELVRGWIGKTPEEVFPDAFSEEQVEKARRKRQRDEKRRVEKAGAEATVEPEHAADSVSAEAKLTT